MIWLGRALKKNNAVQTWVENVRNKTFKKREHFCAGDSQAFSSFLTAKA
jgi:hypothetical protein